MLDHSRINSAVLLNMIEDVDLAQLLQASYSICHEGLCSRSSVALSCVSCISSAMLTSVSVAEEGKQHSYFSSFFCFVEFQLREQHHT